MNLTITGQYNLLTASMLLSPKAMIMAVVFMRYCCIDGTYKCYGETALDNIRFIDTMANSSAVLQTVLMEVGRAEYCPEMQAKWKKVSPTKDDSLFLLSNGLCKFNDNMCWVEYWSHYMEKLCPIKTHTCGE